MTIRILSGDCREVLRTLPDASVHCVVTSPPYWGLRDYGTAEWEGGDPACEHKNRNYDRGERADRSNVMERTTPFRSECGHCGARRIDRQIGLEPGYAEFVNAMVGVFREVRKVLRDDGTLWLNLGDSYAAGGRGGGSNGSKQQTNVGCLLGQKHAPDGLKPKDLVGIPWRVAFALQAPFYTGKVANELDRVWLGAMLDAEGCITASEYEFEGRIKTNIYIGITNASVPIIEKCGRLFPQAKENVYQKGGIINRIVFRWDVERMEQKSLFLREIYPYLVAKRKQAILGYTFLEMQRGLPSKKKGYLPEQQEKRSWLVASLSKLNRGGDVDMPDWAIEPPSLFEPGFYLRQDLIWSKPNPMPESVTDRCTKAHEYMFLLSKSQQYHYDATAIAEPASDTLGAQAWRRIFDPAKQAKEATMKEQGIKGGNDGSGPNRFGETRNRRSVWTIGTEPFPEAHFATFPPALIEPCILAGCPKGGTVLDPFGGAGTTGLVADRLGRNAILIELNPEYAAMAERRIRDDAGMFANVAAE